MEYFKERFDRLLIKSLSITPDEISPEKRFKEDFNLDSLDMIELVIEFEKEFSIAMPDEMAEVIFTISDAENAVRTRVHTTHMTEQKIKNN